MRRAPWSLVVLVLSLACRRSTTPVRALDGDAESTAPTKVARDAGIDAGPADAAPQVDAVVADAALQAPIDGSYLFRERCSGAETTWALDAHGGSAELASSPGTARRLRLRAMPAPDGGEHAFVALPETSLSPVLRGLREGFALRLLPIEDAVSGWYGSFRPTCAAPEDVVFLEAKAEAAQDWGPYVFGTRTLRYPRRLFAVTATAGSLQLLSPDVYGLSMNGGREPFRVRLEVHAVPVLDALKKHLPTAFAQLFPGGTAASFKPSAGFAERARIAEHPGYVVNMGIEGTYSRTHLVELDATHTLEFTVDWASEFANPKIKLSGPEQLAVADVILRSLQL